MTSIQKIVDIPADHRLRLDFALPESIPPGQAEIQATIIPVFPPEKHNANKPIACTASSREAVKRVVKPFEGLAGSLKDSKTFSRRH